MQNTFWSIDRQRDLAFVVFTNLLPFGFAPVRQLYTTVRRELRNGLAQTAICRVEQSLDILL